jgi:hypothetical protein
MLYKLASVLGFAAFFMIETIMRFIKYASLNMEQFAFIFGMNKADPSLGAMLGLEFIFPVLFVMLSLVVGCIATQWSITLIELSTSAIQACLDFGKRTFGKFSKP